MIFEPNNNKIDKEKIGGKAYNLLHLNALNVNVPKWIALTSDCFYEFLGTNKEQYLSLLNNYKKENREKIINLITNTDFSTNLKDKILKKIKNNFNLNDKLAIRSSATDEDGNTFSFAGMLESYLNIEINENIFDYIKKCYLSCFSVRIMEYREKNNLINDSISVCVIIQKMIDADYAGVMFTTNPQTNNTDKTLISIVAGVGENLVSGKNDSSDYVVDCLKNITSKNISNNVNLEENLIIKLYELGELIEKSYEKRLAQDIEFCIKNNVIYILQCRIITNYNYVDKNKFRTILDNSNIIESYSGVTTPLTYTFAKDVYSKIYKQTLRNFFISEQAIKDIENDLDNMLYFYENKIYYRLNSWYKMTSLYPGYEKNKKYMENMMGVKTTLNETKTQAKTRLVRIYTSFICKLLRIKRDSKKFIDKFNSVTKPFYNNKFENYTNKKLLKVYDELEKEILDDFITPIANDMGAMVLYGVLTDKIKKSNIKNYEGVLSSILSKQGNVESVNQSLLLIEIVNDIKKDKEIIRIFEEDNIKEFNEMLKSNSNNIFHKINDYIYNYGPRTIDELKLETITIQEDPTFLFETIKQYLNIDNIPLNKIKDNYEAEKTLYSNYHFLNKQYVKLLVKITKFFIKNRESLRLRRTYIYSIVRNIYLAIGRNFEADKIISNYRDIFYLEKDEITDIIKNNGQDIKDIKKIILERKKEYINNKDKIVYERMYFYGDINSKNVLPIYSKQEKELNSNILSGVAGGGKTVIGKVKLVEDPNNTNVKGFILMAKRTDPGWTVLFPMAKAIIIERGSVLSHSAVVAREMGLTLVVGVRGLTDIVKDGMTVKVDGVNGTIEILGENYE